jgi:DNA mismatch repair protein MutS
MCSIIQTYFDLTKKYSEEYGEKTILLMQVGSFFEVYALYDKETDITTESEIREFGRICDLNIVIKNNKEELSTKWNNKFVIMAGFKDLYIDKYVKKMQDAGFTIIVYTQKEYPPQSGKFIRELSGIFSSGTYFSPTDTQLTNNIICIWIELINSSIIFKNQQILEVGISNIDIFTGKTTMYQFKENYMNNPTTYDQLERFISIYNPNEIIILANLSDNEIENIINYINLKCKMIHIINTSKNHICESINTRVKNCEKQIYQKELLNKFYNIPSSIINDSPKNISAKKQITFNYDIFIQDFNENVVAIQSFCYLLDFVFQHNPYLVHKISLPIFENNPDKLMLANHSLKQLNIIEDDNSYATTVKNYSSVLTLLNQCKTPMGKRKFTYNLLNPTTNTTYLQTEYDITEHIINNYINIPQNLILKKTSSKNKQTQIQKNNTNFINRLKDIKDMSKYQRLLIMKKITPHHIYNLYNDLNIMTDIFNIIKLDKILMTYLSCSNSIYNPILENSFSDECYKIKQFIDENINIDLCKNIDIYKQFDNNFFKNGIDVILDNKSNTLFESLDKLEAIRIYFNSIITQTEKKLTKNDYIKIHETDKNNLKLIGTSRRCNLLKSHLLNVEKNEILVNLKYICSQTNDEKTFEFLFSDNKNSKLELNKQTASNSSISTLIIDTLCKNISSIKIELKDILTRVYGEFINKLEMFLKYIENIIEFITKIDVVFTKGYIANKFNYTKPILIDADKSFIDVQNLRHCLIEILQQNEIYVPNNICLGKYSNKLDTYPKIDQCRDNNAYENLDEKLDNEIIQNNIDGMLLYGTNSTGKSSFIKSIGIAIIMAQAGLYVPASNFEYKPYKGLFTRIIGNDNLFKGLSSFSVEMSELRTILRFSDKNSIILGDELCSSTESVSARAIFVSSLQILSEKKSSFIFATHMHEITKYKEINDINNLVIKHLSVLYNKEKDTLIYNRILTHGAGLANYGLEVCKYLQLSELFLENAYKIRNKYNPEFNSILENKQSHFNSKKIISTLCEICNVQLSDDVHHLIHQSESDENGFIDSFHKNHLANLVSICKTCHNLLHKKENNDIMYKRIFTTKGYKTIQIPK